MKVDWGGRPGFPVPNGVIVRTVSADASKATLILSIKLALAIRSVGCGAQEPLKSKRQSDLGSRPFPNRPYGPYGCKARLNFNSVCSQSLGAVWKSKRPSWARGPSLMVLMVYVDVKQDWTWTRSVWHRKPVWPGGKALGPVPTWS